jgi:predicted O-methyltransferase YrrM
MNTIKNKLVYDTLQDLHKKAEADGVLRKKQKQSGDYERNKHTAYLAVDRTEGEFMNFLATLTGAKQIVEFGCSFGISTIYLAAAAKDNGGRVITTDLESIKVTGAKQNLELAGLADVVEILEGDALQTLATVEGDVDFLFLDGAKDLYIPVFQLMRGQLKKGAIVFADNADKPEVQPFVNYIRQASTEFTSVMLFEGRAFVAHVI